MSMIFHFRPNHRQSGLADSQAVSNCNLLFTGPWLVSGYGQYLIRTEPPRLILHPLFSVQVQRQNSDRCKSLTVYPVQLWRQNSRRCQNLTVLIADWLILLKRFHLLIQNKIPSKSKGLSYIRKTIKLLWSHQQ